MPCRPVLATLQRSSRKWVTFSIDDSVPGRMAPPTNDLPSPVEYRGYAVSFASEGDPSLRARRVPRGLRAIRSSSPPTRSGRWDAAGHSLTALEEGALFSRERALGDSRRSGFEGAKRRHRCAYTFGLRWRLRRFVFDHSFGLVGVREAVSPAGMTRRLTCASRGGYAPKTRLHLPRLRVSVMTPDSSRRAARHPSVDQVLHSLRSKSFFPKEPRPVVLRICRDHLDLLREENSKWGRSHALPVGGDRARGRHLVRSRPPGTAPCPQCDGSSRIAHESRTRALAPGGKSRACSKLARGACDSS